MRWHELFADLEGQASALEQQDRDAEIADRTRAEVGRIALVNRLHAQVGRPLALTLVGGVQVSGTLDRLGAGWLLLTDASEALVPLTALSQVHDLPPAAVHEDGVGVVTSRLSLSSAIRAVAVDRAPVEMTMVDRTTVVGTPDRVGADFVDVAVHEPDLSPRRSQVRGRVTVAYQALAVVRRLNPGW